MIDNNTIDIIVPIATVDSSKKIIRHNVCFISKLEKYLNSVSCFLQLNEVTIRIN